MDPAIMGFMLRSLFWFSVVAMALPEAPETSAPPAAPVKGTAARNTEYSTAIGQLERLCESTPKLCAEAVQQLSALGYVTAPQAASWSLRSSLSGSGTHSPPVTAPEAAPSSHASPASLPSPRPPT